MRIKAVYICKDLGHSPAQSNAQYMNTPVTIFAIAVHSIILHVYLLKTFSPLKQYKNHELCGYFICN